MESCPCLICVVSKLISESQPSSKFVATRLIRQQPVVLFLFGPAVHSRQIDSGGPRPNSRNCRSRRTLLSAPPILLPSHGQFLAEGKQ
jgi:hypothetical protein